MELSVKNFRSTMCIKDFQQIIQTLDYHDCLNKDIQTRIKSQLAIHPIRFERLPIPAVVSMPNICRKPAKIAATLTPLIILHRKTDAFF